MLFLSLQSPEFSPAAVDGVEFRIDSCIPQTLPDLPTLLTFKKPQHPLIDALLELKPAFIDLEYDTPPDLLRKISEKFPHTQIILSYHNYTHTPPDLEALLSQMKSPYAFAYKIASHAQSTLDALRMLLFVKNHPEIRLSGICMGELGQATRILGPIFGNFIDYTFQEKETAPGQISLQELVDIYHYPDLNLSTKIYALIGDPVVQSFGHKVHNPIMQKWNAVYVKLRITQKELPEFMTLAKSCGFAGLSVTMPLKEAICSFLESSPLGALNTVAFQNNPIGINTDGIGALNAIEEKLTVKNKTILILGAGGAARAIAYEARKRGAHVLIFNRTKARADLIASELNCTSIDDPSGIQYDILINATPSCPDVPFIPGTLALDIQITPSPFLQRAQSQGCQIIYGHEMWHHQAKEQQHFWLHCSLLITNALSFNF